MASRCKYLVLPTICLVLTGMVMIIVSGLVNTGLLMGLSHSLVNKTYNTSQTIECDPLNILCETSNRMISFYNGNEFGFLFGWAMVLVVIELVKFLVILSLAYGLYRLYLRQYLMDLVALFPSVKSKDKENEDNNDTLSSDDIEIGSPRKSDENHINFEDTTEEETI